jgi:hypothetical protein
MLMYSAEELGIFYLHYYGGIILFESGLED